MGAIKDLDLKNIKKAKTGGYQIQFIVNGKSYSDFSMDINKAVKIRDKMRKQLKIVPNGAFKKRNQKGKKSVIPGTREKMAAGITFTKFMSRGSETYYILVNWRDAEGKHKTKSYYCGRDSTYTTKRGQQIYKLALKFRKAYEKAVLNEAVESFDPAEFNVGKSQQQTKKKTKAKTTKAKTAKAKTETNSDIRQKKIRLSRSNRRRSALRKR